MREMEYLRLLESAVEQSFNAVTITTARLVKRAVDPGKMTTINGTV